MKTKDIILIDRHYQRKIDAWLVLGQKRQDRELLPVFVAGWQPRLATNKLFTVKKFFDLESAQLYFRKTLHRDKSPKDKLFSRDLQKKNVYAWEDKHLDRYDCMLKDKDATRDLVRQIAKDYKTKKPFLVLGKNGRDHYDPDDDKLQIGTLSLLRLLHEMTHMLNTQFSDESENGPDHGPAFVWMAIELYHRYAGLDLNYLVETAAQRDLLGPLNESHRVFPQRMPLIIPAPVRKLH